MKYGPEPNPEASARFIRVGSHFDGLGTLVHRKIMDDDFVPETTAIALISFWEKFEPASEAFAKVYRRPGCWDPIKYLYDKLHKIEYHYGREHYEERLEEELRRNESDH